MLTPPARAPGDCQQVFHELAAGWFPAVSELECPEGQQRGTADRQAIASAMFSARQMPAGRDDRTLNWDKMTDRDFNEMVRSIHRNAG